MQKEAKARIKINKLLEESGWRFFKSPEGPATIIVEPNIKIEDTGCTITWKCQLLPKSFLF